MPSEFGFKSGKPRSHWNQWSSLITGCISWKLEVLAIGGPSDHSDGVSIQKLSSKKGWLFHYINFAILNNE